MITEMFKASLIVMTTLGEFCNYLPGLLVHEFRHAAVGILQVSSEMVMLLALFF